MDKMRWGSGSRNRRRPSNMAMQAMVDESLGIRYQQPLHVQGAGRSPPPYEPLSRPVTYPIAVNIRSAPSGGRNRRVRNRMISVKQPSDFSQSSRSTG